MATQTVTNRTAAVKPPESGNGKPPADKEAKDAKFKRLANARVPAAVKRIRHVANLANKLQYTYTPEQVATIVKMLRGEVDALERRFTATSATNVVTDLF